ncbi:MAG: hypothetical protein HYS27_20695 [Deltaproteobacteria bacterium]|nr:hypothetical protein [Deltaproteobacteria bacterium]
MPVQASSAFTRFQTVLGEIRKAQGAGTEAGAKIGDGEAQKILEAFGKLEGPEKTAAGAAIKSFLQADVFEVTDGARGAFAKALGLDPSELSPQPAATGAKRTVLDHAFKLMSGPHKLDKAAMDELKAGLKELPQGLGDFLVHALNVGVADGDLKMDPAARKEHVKEVAERNRDGRLDMLASRFGEKFAKNVPPYVLSCLSSPPKFEELVFIFMITFVSQTQNEVMEEQKRIAGIVSDDQKRAQTKEDRNKAFGKLPGVTTGEGGGHIDRIVGDPTKRGQAGHVERTKRQVEGTIGAIHDAVKNDGRIDAKESKGIVDKLNRLAPAVKTLFAQAVGTAIEHSGVLDRGPEIADNVKPIWEWAKNVAGVKSFPKPTEANGAEGSLGKALMKSDRLEMRVAGFIVDSFIDKRSVVKLVRGKEGEQTDSVKKFAPLLDQMLANKAPEEMQVRAASPDSKGTDGAILSRLERLAEARPQLEAARAKVAKQIAEGKLPKETKLPPSFEEAVATTVQRECADLPKDKQEAMKAAVNAALAKLPTERAATKEEVSAAFSATTGKVIDAFLDEKDPNVDKVIGGSVEKALQGAAGSIDNIVDAGGAPPSPAQKADILKGALAEQRAQLLDEAKERGLDDKQAEALGKVFDRAGERELQKLAQTGKVEPREPPGAGKDSVDPGQTDDTRSRQIMFENLKFKMNMLSEMMQSMSNILNTMHQNAENTIRAIR